MSTDDPTTASFLVSRRLWLRLVAVVAVVFVLIFVFVLWLLTHLEHPWVKSRIEGALSNAVGTSLTYERLSISPFSGVELEGLRVATPEPLREHAEEMLRLDRLELPIELGPLFSGDIVVPGVEGGALALDGDLNLYTDAYAVKLSASGPVARDDGFRRAVSMLATPTAEGFDIALQGQL